MVCCKTGCVDSSLASTVDHCSKLSAAGPFEEVSHSLGVPLGIGFHLIEGPYDIELRLVALLPDIAEMRSVARALLGYFLLADFHSSYLIGFVLYLTVAECLSKIEESLG